MLLRERSNLCSALNLSADPIQLADSVKVEQN